MKFYTLVTNYDEAVRGLEGCQVIPNKEAFLSDYQYLYKFWLSQNNSGQNIGKEIEKDIVFNLSLLSGANLTDLMLMGHFNDPIGLLISRKLKAILNDFNLPKAQWFNTVFANESRIENKEYCFFYPIKQLDCIHLGLSIGLKGAKAEISEEEYLKIRKKSFKTLLKYHAWHPKVIFKERKLKDAIRFRKIHLKENVFEKYDFICFRYDMRYFVSERLVNRCTEEGITGLNFKAIERLEDYFVFE